MVDNIIDAIPSPVAQEAFSMKQLTAVFLFISPLFQRDILALHIKHFKYQSLLIEKLCGLNTTSNIRMWANKDTLMKTSSKGFMIVIFMFSFHWKCSRAKLSSGKFKIY